MIGSLLHRYRVFRGTGGTAPIVPALDGPYKPNRLLDEADVACAAENPDNLVVVGNRVQFTSGARLCTLEAGGGYSVVEEFARPVSAAAVSPSGRLVLAERGGRMVVRGPGSPQRFLTLPLAADITAMAFAGERSLIVAVGSAENGVDAWTRDILERRSVGSVWRVDTETGQSSQIAERLAYPAGIVARDDGSLIVAEAGRHRLIQLMPQGSPRELVVELPGYPARFAPASDGGVWLAVMAPRNQLVEFVQREDGYRRRMMAEVQPAHWIAPSLRPPASILDPLQQGGQRTLGKLKPWAPSFSFGLVIKLDRTLRPETSYYSRADGYRHGIRSVVEREGRILAASYGADAILSLDLGREEVRHG
jgi:hypothetical protein